ncbi:MAG: transcription-repair coupling factor [Solirubrobacteraceae bacterium]
MSKKNSVQDFLQDYKTNSYVEKIMEWFGKPNSNQSVHLKNLLGSSQSIFLSILFKENIGTILLIAKDKKNANYLLNDLELFLPKESILYFPESYKIPYEIETVQNSNIVLRAEVLNKMANSNENLVVVTYPKAVSEKVISKNTLEKNTLQLTVGDKVSTAFITETLFEYQFLRVDFVSQPGEFSVRGGIIDIFSYAAKKPFRISFFGDEVENIRVFEIESQLSVQKVNKAEIIPNIEDKNSNELRLSFFDYFKQNNLLFIQDIEETKAELKSNYEKSEKNYANFKDNLITRISPKDLFINENKIDKLSKFKIIECGSTNYFKNSETIELNYSVQPSFNNQFQLLAENIKEFQDIGYKIYIFCNSEKQFHRFNEIFDGLRIEISFNPIIASIHEGFIDHSQKIITYTDHQIFGRAHKYIERNAFAKSESLTLKDLTDLQVGDYVTHIDFGIGQFAGLKKIEVNGKWQEAIKLIYLNNDLLYVNIHSLHKIAKYSSKDSKVPKINKLGSPAWKAIKNKTKQRLKEIAFDLLKLYAKRKTERSFSFSADNYLQYELESSFIYEDTPDQVKATQDVKADMESDLPMDRLICGDVGFGKTEIAIRAAFKAANDGKQVVILVPTTILAFQHYRSFSARLKEFPVKVDYLNRFRTSKDRKRIIEELENGKIDIVIGTHQLINQSITYKDIGLLIVDEEHKFGVGIKEKLKNLKSSLDTLTLTATPIPRTLQFSLIGARDMSLIKTPPPNRQPTETAIVNFSEEKIRDAIFFEIQRGGQVYFINNRIENLQQIAGLIQRLVPDTKIAWAHGQMEGNKLESVFLDFLDRKFDVLVSTSIIESGLDIPTANTIIINDAHNFGLADLHQMRGRVGRSNVKAYCYLISPPVSVLSNESKKRLQAIEDFSDLGSGFFIAMKDLEIRGAGDLLGAEQSGFINEMGFETYQKILNEAVEELKNGELDDCLDEDETEQLTKKTFVREVQIDTDLELLIPHNYINNVRERYSIYTQLAQLNNVEELNVFNNNLVDRFGKIPPETKELLKSVELKWLAKEIGFEKVVIKENTLIGYFISDMKSTYYQSKTFQKLLEYVNKNNYGIFKEKTTKNNTENKQLILRFGKINSISEAYNKLLVLAEIK